MCMSAEAIHLHSTWFYSELACNWKHHLHFSHTYVFALASRNNKPKNKIQTIIRPLQTAKSILQSHLKRPPLIVPLLQYLGRSTHLSDKADLRLSFSCCAIINMHHRNTLFPHWEYWTVHIKKKKKKKLSNNLHDQNHLSFNTFPRMNAVLNPPFSSANCLASS